MTNQTSIEFMNAYLNTSFEGTALPPEYFSFLQHFYSHAYAGMLIQYIQNGAAENPEAAAQRFFAISEYGMKSAIDQFLHYKQNGQSLMITGTQSAAYRQTCEPLSIQEQIAVSFKKLCCTKSIQKISVASITDASHVNRSTYYYYFKNKEELISFIFKHDISSHMIPASPNFWIYNTRHFLEILQQDISFYSQIAKSDYIHTLRTLILENTAERTREYFDYCCQKLSVTEEDRQFFIYFYAYAFTGMYIEYIENNASIPFERYTEYFYYVSEPACRLSIEALVSLNKTTALPNSI
jgi:AcrR family transcriptional regulator